MDIMDSLDAIINDVLGGSVPMLKLLLALAVGVIIGWEREYRENIPGMRILALVAVGATLFTGYGGVEGKEFTNPQVAAGVVTGVGFLGAGVIMRASGVLTGVTTAASIWVTAALGMGIALGFYAAVVLVTGAVMIILWYFPRFTTRSNHNLFYEIIAPYDENRHEQFNRRFGEHKLNVLRHSWSRNEDQMICVWYTNGQPDQHERLTQLFISDLEITQFNTKLN